MKRTYFKFILPVVVALMAWSCTKEINLEPEGQWSLSTAVIVAPVADASVVLDESTPNGKVDFQWQAASSSAGYWVTYSVVIDTLGSENFDTPILEIQAGNMGKALTASIKFKQLDEALSYAGYPANSLAHLSWAVKATCLSRSSFAIGAIAVTRFVNEMMPTQLFLSGKATEGGEDLSKAIAFKRLSVKGSDGKIVPSNKFEVYTSLKADMPYKIYGAKSLPTLQYGGSDSILVKSGNTGKAIVTSVAAVYHIVVDMDNLNCQLTKIDRMGVIGDSFSTGWGADVPLDYQGGGVWKGLAEVVAKKDFIFRTNAGWSDLFKLKKGTTKSVELESQAILLGDTLENIPTASLGIKQFTLDLSAGGYTCLIEKDPNAPISIAAPSHLFLLAGGVSLVEFTQKDGVFTAPVYLPLQGSVIYTLNSAADGSGKKYTIAAKIGATNSVVGDKISGNAQLSEEDGTLGAEYDQAYNLSVDFSAATLSWSYYNLKLFHWTDWNTRIESLMTYSHPFTYKVTTTLEAGNKTKFNSPWDVQFGALANVDNVSAMSGTTTNGGTTADFICITVSGTYDATLISDNLYKKGTYEFVAK